MQAHRRKLQVALKAIRDEEIMARRKEIEDLEDEQGEHGNIHDDGDGDSDEEAETTRLTI